ncbi:MAG TPA: hypothetical protein VMS22_12735 [Candidatus Eisenbacteria bacterium]|nr:hypothetical protein [Candidatus Eisenbacteria bacterium]
MVIRLLALGVAVGIGVARADVQRIAPGTGLQNAVVVDTGANGICETAAVRGDLQAGTVGGGAMNRPELRCGPNRDVETAAQGDDVQLIAVGGVCRNNAVIIDTGANGIPETIPLGDDVYVGGIALGVPPANAPCVVAGADGIAQTAAPGGDDQVLIVTGRAEPNTDVVRCGPNGVAETSANNVAAGDDVQVIPIGMACAQGQAVVDSGADGIATTRAQGADLRIELARPVRLVVDARRPSASRRLKFLVRNVEFGATAPSARAFRLRATGGSCPGGTVTQIDADPRTPGLQATAPVGLGKSAKATLVATIRLENVTTVDKKNPYRCSFDVSAVAFDTDPDVDDAANDDANTTPVLLEVLDKSDLQKR